MIRAFCALVQASETPGLERFKLINFEPGGPLDIFRAAFSSPWPEAGVRSGTKAGGYRGFDPGRCRRKRGRSFRRLPDLWGVTLERFPAKWMPVRVTKTRQNKKIEPPFRFNRNGKGSTCAI